MTKDLAVLEPSRGEVSPAARALRDADYERVAQYIQPALAPNTLRSYRSHLRQFADFCADRELPSLPASEGTVIAYLTYAVRNGMRPSSARIARSVIGVTHDRAGQPNPTKSQATRDALANLEREFGCSVRRAEPMLAEHVLRTVGHLGPDLPGLRDKAIILLGFGVAMRQSEIVALDVADFEPMPGGRARVHIRRSKTDQTAKGLTGVAPVVAMTAVRAWWAAAGITSGPAFRRMTRWGVGRTRLTAQSVRLIVKARAGHAGLDPDGDLKWSGHSLRRGAATEAVSHGADQRQLMNLGRWTSTQGADPYVDRREVQDPDAVLGLDGAL